MNINQLKALPLEEAIEIINNDLRLLAANGKMTSSFGKDEIDGLVIKCAWTTVTNHYGPLGYKLNRKSYQFEYQEELAENRRVELPFDEEEIGLLKLLIEKADDLLKEKAQGESPEKEEESKELRIKPKKGKKKVTSFSIYEDTLHKWNQFKDQYAYNPTDLLDRALIEFMEKYKLEQLEEMKSVESVEEKKENSGIKVSPLVIKETSPFEKEKENEPYTLKRKPGEIDDYEVTFENKDKPNL